MALGGAGCAAGGLLVASGAEITVSATAARLLIQGIPLVGGAALVVVGAAVRRAVRRARTLGAADAERLRALGGVDAAILPHASLPPRDHRALRQVRRGEAPPTA